MNISKFYCAKVANFVISGQKSRKILNVICEWPLSRPGSTTSMGSRHESELMDQLRKVEESAAKDKWRNIVHFCKEVSVLLKS